MRMNSATTETEVSWIYRGQPLAAQETLTHAQTPAFDLLDRQGFVKIESSARGTKIEWSVFAPNWASLYFTMEWLHTYPGPYNLRYYLSGWFDEKYNDVNAARNRIDIIIGKSDIHLTRHTFVTEADPHRANIPDLLKTAFDDGAVNPKFAVDCILDETSGKFSVDRVGQKSEIARLWGMNPVSFPCLTGHSYDQVVSAAYRKVVLTDRPHYDHIIAAMSAPDSTIFWCPYQRVILPHRFDGNRKGVVVVSKVGPVDIKVI
ncbi:hypothetical protein G5V57_25950 [Nordella sp. HKS 07]|uniref:hypothetical protein n=1 Tax=Nordella sp. HKS 07 TaxID=2712222 RepID=UPI0013E1822C|nr:hypothetical protein [Nordella sp. HKS 07]QIG50872.1 hypothetical protein G5V57_25950 [Nordella sp. HKS 07]